MNRTSIALPESLAADLEAHKRDEQTWPAFVREDVIPALEAADGSPESVDYAEVERRCERAVESALSDR